MISSIQAHRPLDGLTTFGTRSEADHYAEAGSLDELEAHLAEANANGLPVHFLGAGANTIAMSRVPGMTIRITIKGVEMSAAPNGDVLVKCGAGEVFDDIVARTLKAGIGGLENLSAIPGTVGGAVVQNIGAYGVELADRFDSLTAWDVLAGRYVEMSAADCRFAYRDSVFKHQPPGRWVIVAVRLRLPRPWRPVLSYPDLQRHPGLAGEPSARAIFEAVCEIRRAKLPDPAVTGNAGSFFKNPIVSAAQREALAARYPGLVSYPQPDGGYKLAAGWLIDQCGWKGRALGAAGVHDRQALVLVNRGGATAADILALARAIQGAVAERYGVALEPEPVVV